MTDPDTSDHTAADDLDGTPDDEARAPLPGQVSLVDDGSAGDAGAAGGEDAGDAGDADAGHDGAAARGDAHSGGTSTRAASPDGPAGVGPEPGEPAAAADAATATPLAVAADASTAAAAGPPPDAALYRRSLYRAYRPQTFSEVVGQDHVARTLTNAITLGTVAHGYVFAGPRGTGKTSMARILAKALNCAGPDPQHAVTAPTTTPCGVCESCVRIAAAESLDVIEMDAASHRSIDDIRELRDTIAYAPVQSRYKVYIIDEAHMLTREAFNALLKTLEEPPPNVVFVLATTEAHKLPDTIVSRCQRFDFRRPRSAEVVRVLRRVAQGEGFEVDDDALDTIAEHSEGGFRDAIGALERLATFAHSGERIGTADVLELLGVTDTELLIEITEIVADQDTVEALAFVHRLYDRGINWTQFINDLLRHLRRLFLLQNVGHGASDPSVVRALAQTVGLHEQLIERLEPQASRLDRGTVIRMMELLGQALGDIKAGLDGRLQLELTVVKVTQPHLDLSLEGLDARLRRLEEGAAPVASDTPTAPTRVAPATATPATPTPPGPHDAAPASVAEEAPASVAEEAPATDEPASVAEGPASVAEEPARVADNGPMPAPPLEEEPAPPLDDEPAPPPGDDPAPPPEGPAPQAAESPAPQTAAPLLQRAQESWPQIIERLGSHSPPAASMLRGGRPCAERGGRITIAVGAQFNRDRLAESGNAAVVAGAVSEVLHQAVTVSFEVDASLVEQPAAAPERGRGLSIDEAIALSQEKLGARLIDDENGR
jgi:DNA polymerase-3 subunit gamma/tau